MPWDEEWYDEEVSELQEGSNLEVFATDAGGAVRGKALLKVEEAFEPDDDGAAVTCEVVAAEEDAVYDYLEEKGDRGLIHLCRGRAAHCEYRASGYDVMHVEAWRRLDDDQLGVDYNEGGEDADEEEDDRDERGGTRRRAPGKARGRPPPSRPRAGGLGGKVTTGGRRRGAMGAFDDLADEAAGDEPATPERPPKRARADGPLEDPSGGLAALGDPSAERKATADAIEKELVAAQAAAEKITEEKESKALMAAEALERDEPGAILARRAGEVAGSHKRHGKTQGKHGRSDDEDASEGRTRGRSSKKAKIIEGDPEEDEITDSEMALEKQLFRDAPAAKGAMLNQIQRVGLNSPGVLLKQTLQEMRRYMDPRLLSCGGKNEDGGKNETRLMPLALAYLTTVVLPNREKGVGLRNERELRTLAKAIDLILEGKLLSAGDLLSQRFKAVESASADASWEVASHLELLPPAKPTAVSVGERAAATGLLLKEERLRELLLTRGLKLGGLG